MNVKRLRSVDSKKSSRGIWEWLSVTGAVASALGAIIASVIFFSSPDAGKSGRDSDLRRIVEVQRDEAAVLKAQIHESQLKLDGLSTDLLKATSEIRTLRSLASVQVAPGHNQELTSLLESTRRSVGDVSGQLAQVKQRIESY